MKRIKSWETITEIGKKVEKGWKNISDLNKLDLETFGIPSLVSYNFKSENNLEYKTLITQEMLKRGFLPSDRFYACISHSENHINNYLNELNDVFNVISKCEKDQISINDLLEGPVKHSGFKRLN